MRPHGNRFVWRSPCLTSILATSIRATTSGTGPTEAAAAGLMTATGKTTRASPRFDPASVGITTLGRWVVVQAAIDNTLTSTGATAVTMPVRRNANATAVSATPTHETRSRAT